MTTLVLDIGMSIGLILLKKHIGLFKKMNKWTSTWPRNYRYLYLSQQNKIIIPQKCIMER